MSTTDCAGARVAAMLIKRKFCCVASVKDQYDQTVCNLAIPGFTREVQGLGFTT
jgi:hypothetical protein